MAKLSQSEILAIVDSEFSSAMGSPGGDIAQERALALKYHNADPYGDEVEGKSQQVTADVMEVVDGVMPSLLRIFTTRENLVSFDPVGPEDEEQAAQETDYTTHVLFKNEDLFMSQYSWFWDGLVQKNGIIKAWMDKSERVTEETYTRLTEDELLKLLEDEELEPVEQDEYEDTTIIDGQEVRTTLRDMTFKRTTTRGFLQIEPVPPEEYRISSDATRVNPSKARMVGQERDVKRQELIDMGFDKDLVMDLPQAGHLNETEEERARNGQDETRVGSPDHMAEEVQLREAYILLDMEGNGKLERRQVFTSNSILLGNESADRQPYHVLTSKPIPHKHFGSCTAELVMDIQRVRSELLRQALNNIYQTNMPGHLLYTHAIGENTMDGFLTTEISRVVEVDRPVNEAHAPLVTPFTAQHSFAMLAEFDKQKRDRTGVSSDSEGLTPEALKHIQSSVLTTAIDMSKMKIEMIARIFAETGIKSLMLHVHELLRKHPDKKAVAKLRGKWVEVDPTSWRDRTDLTVNVGLGIGSRESNLIHLNAIKELQQTLVAAGQMNLTVSPQNIYNTASELVKNANLKDPEMYFTDPGDQQGPLPTQEQMQLQQQAMLLQQQQAELEQQKEQFNNDMMKHEREMLKIAQDQEQHDDDIAVQLEKLQNQITEMELKYEQPIPEPTKLRFDPNSGQIVN